MTAFVRRAALALLVGLVSRAHVVGAQYKLAPPSVYVHGSTLPGTGVLVASGSAVLVSASVYPHFGGGCFLQLYDATSQPAGGASPSWSSAFINNNVTGTALVPAGGITFLNGIYAILSEEGSTYLAAPDTVSWYSVTYRRPP